MNRIIAIAAALAFSSPLVQAQGTTDKIKEAGAANTKATNAARDKKRAEDDARSKANIEARNKNKGSTVSVPASVKKTHDGVDKKRSEDKSPAPKR